MAYDIVFEERITNYLESKSANFYAKKMMGGLTFMVNDKMCVGLLKDQLMARIAPEFYPLALEMDKVHEMNFTGRSMKGFVFIDIEALDFDEDLEYWVDKCLEFNPRAKSSKKRK